MASSCELDLTPTSSITYKEGDPIFNSSSDVESFDNGLHSSFRSLFMGDLYQLPELVCDGFNATMNYNNHYGGEHQVNKNFNASSSYVETVWGYHYLAINNYNIVIANANNQVPESLREEVDLVVGHAYFYRAVSYLTLARYFGKAYDSATAATDLCVPLVLAYDQQAKPARATVLQIYNQVKTDLDFATYYLKDEAGEIGAQIPTIDAVNAVYARYYLDVANYDKAAEYADKVINSSAKYALASSETAMAQEYTSDAGSEPIMQMYASIQEGAGACQMFLGEGGLHSDADGKAYASYYIPTQNLIDQYELTDLRFRAWFDKSSYPFYCNGATYTNLVYAFVKYPGNPSLYSGTTSNGAQAKKPFMIGEQYLIAAEAYLKAGNALNAAARLNALQKSRNATVTAATLDNIKKEWRKETVGEGLRFSCLKRWGEGTVARTPQTDAADNSLVMTTADFTDRIVSADDYHFCWPVPSYEMKVNDNLVQNPGYSVE